MYVSQGERCDSGPKKQTFWKTIKPFITDKNACQNNKIIRRGVTKSSRTPNKFVMYLMSFFTSVANDTGFDDTIPSDYYTTEGFSSIIIQWHRDHPSIIKIKKNNPHSNMFQFQCINRCDVVNIIHHFDGKQAKAMIGCQ